ncbi:hypothetical protein [Acinetobacter soli]|uniref:hypothetical protein n=1 Tax=Acinetobacter soli TaxID=487316 RepID=UPI00280F6E56|nr:hypothetical protein [Acinetobacter soli]MDQ8943815.1 hypothetical protein [Acinetobacter soli]
MKLVTVLLKNFDVKVVGEKKVTKYVFEAMETDLNGARIPTEIQTFNEDIKNKLIKYSNTPEPILLPFSSSNFYMGKSQYTVDSIILHPDFEVKGDND